MKNFLLLALTATALLSCSKENGELPATGDTKTVRLSIMSQASSKAAEEAGEAHKTPIADFTVYFINSSGGVVETRPSGTIESSGSYVFEEVSGLATKIFIVANAALTNTTLGGSTLTDLKANVLKIKDYQTGIDNVILAAADASAIEEDAMAGEGKYKATVILAPVVARLEIAQIKSVSANDPALSDITGYTVENIYVNAYDPTMPLVGAASGRVAGSALNFANTDLKDEHIDLTASNSVVTPVAPGEVWAYQLFAGNSPTMVIQFSSITFANGTTLTAANVDNANELCITVTGFTPPIFAAAKIYKVASIDFSTKNIGKPYQVSKNIAVTLDVAPWSVEATSVTLQ